MKEKRLYFITGINNLDCYNYHYILAFNRAEAKEKFISKYFGYEIDEIKIISPSPKLMKEYETINQAKENR